MAFRLLRIFDSEDKFETRLSELKKVRSLPGATYSKRRNLAFIKKTRVKNTERVIAPFDFNPVLPKLSSVLTKHHRTMLSDNPDLKKVFPKPPMASLRQGPNLRRILCKATLPKISRNPTRATHRSTSGWRRCSTTTGRQCPICPLTPTSASSVTSHLTNYTHTINTSLNCKSENVIYIWKCIAKV